MRYTEQQPEQKSLKFLITIFGDNERPEFEYSFKWSKEDAAERILSNYHNLFIESKTTGITLEVTFNNLQQELSLSNAVYYLRMYESAFEQIIYLEEDNVKPKIEPIYETRLGYSNQETTTAYLKLPKLNREYFITLSLYARIADNAEDFKLGYMPLMIDPVLEGLENTNEFFPLTDVFKVVKLPDDSDDFTVLGYVTEGIDNNAKLGIAFITYDDLEPLYHGYFMSPSSYMQFHTVEGTGSVSVKRTSKYTEYMLITSEATSTQNTKIGLIVLPYNNKAYDFMLPANKYFIDSFMEGNDNHKLTFDPLTVKEVTIGRDSKCTFAFPKDKSFSRCHTTFTWDDGERIWKIIDGSKNKSSTNGTWVFGTHSFQIQDQMVVEILTSKIRFSVMQNSDK